MATNTEKIVIQVQVKGLKDVNKLESGMKKSSKATGGFTKSMIKAGAAIGSALIIFRQLNKTIGSAIGTFKKFEFEMAKVKAITGATDKDFKKLTNTAQQLGRSTFFTASQVAELQVAYGKLGFTTSEILDAQEATLMLATATQSDLGRAAIVAGAAVRGFGLDASETQRVVDVMAVAFTSSALDIEKWQTSMTKVSPIASAAGITIESTAAIMGTLTDAGIEASIAGTSLRNIFLKMQDPTSDLTKKIGFTVNSSADLEKALLKLNAEGLSNAEMMELVDLRQVAAFTTMINGTDNVLSLTDALEDSNGEAQKMADIMADTLEGDLLKAKSAWEGFEIAIVGGGTNIDRALRKIVSSWTTFISDVVDNMRTSEQLGADFLTQSLKSVKKMEDAGKAVQKVQSEVNVTLKTRSELLQEEADKMKRVQKLQKDVLETVQKQAESGLDIGGAAATVAEDLTKQLEAREFALADLEEMIEQEIKKEKNKSERIQLDKDIALEKARRAQEKADKIKRDEADKLAKEKLAQEKKDFQASKKELETALKEELNAEKENLINKVITQEEYDKRAFEAEQAHLDNMKDLNIAYEESTAGIQSEMLDNELARIAAVAAAEKKAKDKKDKDDDDALEKRKEMKQFALDTASELNDALFEIDSQNRNRQQSQELKMLEERKESGVITQEKYEQDVEKINRAAFEKEKSANIGKAIMGTALAIIKASPNILKMALAGVAGAAQLAVISNQKFADGGMVYGNSHAQGGVKFAVGGRVNELEGGEAVINKRSTAMYKPLLSSINSMGGGVKFADGGLLNQPSFAQSQFNALGQAGMMGAISQGSQVVVVESDITNSQNTVSTIQSQASF